MRSWVLSLLLLAAAASVSEANCPNGWLYYETKCYKFMDSNEETWPDAVAACDSALPGSTLASVHDHEQNAFLETLAGYGVTWIGLSRDSTNGNWTWTDGSDFDFNNWYYGQPDVDGAACVESNCWGNGEWCDFECDATHHKRSFICQVDYV